MKRALLLGISALAFATTSAFAADLPARMPAKAPAYIPLAYTWTGFYLGGNFGWGWSSGDATTVLGGVTGTTSGTGNGALGGLQAGYNWQTGALVFGVETDIQLSGGSGNFTGSNGAITTTGTAKNPWFGTIRGRLGYAFAPRWLAYVTGGGAYGENKIDGTIGGAGFSSSANFWTWTVGGGIETAVWDRWTAKIEYLHFGKPDNVPLPPGVTLVPGNAHGDLIRGGLNYHF